MMHSSHCWKFGAPQRNTRGSKESHQKEHANNCSYQRPRGTIDSHSHRSMDERLGDYDATGKTTKDPEELKMMYGNGFKMLVQQGKKTRLAEENDLSSQYNEAIANLSNAHSAPLDIKWDDVTEKDFDYFENHAEEYAKAMYGLGVQAHSKPSFKDY